MADVYVNAEGLEVKNRDVVFEIKGNEGKLGELRVSRGSVEWKPANYKYGFHLEWEAFDRLMQEQGDQR